MEYLLKKIAAFAGLLQIAVILGWMIFNIIYSNTHPEPALSFPTMGQAAGSLQGLIYYQHRFAIIGFDHGTKAIVFLISMLLPIAIFTVLHKRGFPLGANLVGMISGVLSSFILSVSFILQATLAEYAIHLYGATHTAFAHNFAVYLFDWGMEQGGFSDSLYIISNILSGIWLITHSYGIGKMFNKKVIWLLGWIWALLTFVSGVIPFTSLMNGMDSAHMFSQVVGMIGVIWIPLVAVWLIRVKD